MLDDRSGESYLVLQYCLRVSPNDFYQFSQSLG